MAFDFWGQLVGKAVRRQIEKEAAQGTGPVLDALKPILTVLVQVEVGNQLGKIDSFVQAKTGVGNLAGLLSEGISGMGNPPQAGTTLPQSGSQ